MTLGKCIGLQIPEIEFFCLSFRKNLEFSIEHPVTYMGRLLRTRIAYGVLLVYLLLYDIETIKMIFKNIIPLV